MLQWSSERTRLELQMRGSVKRLQLDNQMLDATQPVVVAPASAAHAHSETAASLRGTDAPLVTFAVTRSFANNLTLNAPADSTTSLPAGNHATPMVQVHLNIRRHGMQHGIHCTSLNDAASLWGALTVASLSSGGATSNLSEHLFSAEAGV